MKIKAQMTMVMNLDKCIGCHTCSLPCKKVWTNRKGAEYIWYNNVETKPGIGYPKRWEDQKIHRGGWAAGEKGLRLKAGSPSWKLLNLFHNPDLPSIDEYYEPWTYDYQKLIDTPPRRHQPAIRPVSQITGENMRVEWGPNWEDDLAGIGETGPGDVNFQGLDAAAYLRFKNVFMFYLPRICEHCLNPACVASCPSSALYKRQEDGIVLVDQEKCRGWRYCISGCPYKKVYFNWKNGRSEKCIFCYPRVEAGEPTLCAETCVGRIRYIGVILYDADRVREAAAVVDDARVYHAHMEIILDPGDRDILRQARREGLAENTLEAAQASPVYRLIKEWKLALPPHPEFRTLPMVWYIPPLSPFVHGMEESEAGGGFPRLEEMRIPIRYLANLLSAGDEGPVRFALERLTALRAYMRSKTVDREADESFLTKVNLSPRAAEEMFHLLSVAKYKDRYVIPKVKHEISENAYELQGKAGYPEEGP